MFPLSLLWPTPSKDTAPPLEPEPKAEPNAD